MPTPVQDAYELVTETRKQFNAILKTDPNLAGVIEASNKHFELLLTRLRYAGHTLEPDNDQHAPQVHETMKTFMGKPITRQRPLAKGALNPKAADAERFLVKVKKLEEEIVSMNPVSVINAYTQPEDLLVLRGVAKRAGMADFKERPIDSSFITDIKHALHIKNGMQSAIEDQSKQLPEEFAKDAVLNQENLKEQVQNTRNPMKRRNQPEQQNDNTNA